MGSTGKKGKSARHGGDDASERFKKRVLWSRWSDRKNCFKTDRSDTIAVLTELHRSLCAVVGT